MPTTRSQFWSVHFTSGIGSPEIPALLNDVEPAVTLSDAADQGGDVVFPADIGAHELGFPAALLDLRHQGSPSCLVEVGADHERALAGELQRGGLADARRSATTITTRSANFISFHALALLCAIAFLSLSPGRWESVVRARDRAHPRDDQGGLLSAPFQLLLPDACRAAGPAPITTRSIHRPWLKAQPHVEVGEPAQRPQASMKQYSPPRLTTNWGSSVRRWRIRRDGNRPVPSCGLQTWSSRRVLEEGAVVDPLGLDELELPGQIRLEAEEQDAAIGPVVLQDALGQHRAVAGATADDPVIRALCL